VIPVDSSHYFWSVANLPRSGFIAQSTHILRLNDLLEPPRGRGAFSISMLLFGITMPPISNVEKRAHCVDLARYFLLK